MEGVIEARDLRQLGICLGYRFDSRQVVRKVQREERHQLLDAGDNVGVEPYRGGVRTE